MTIDTERVFLYTELDFLKKAAVHIEHLLNLDDKETTLSLINHPELRASIDKAIECMVVFVDPETGEFYGE